jgi:hypothetical protein
MSFTVHMDRGNGVDGRRDDIIAVPVDAGGCLGFSVGAGNTDWESWGQMLAGFEKVFPICSGALESFLVTIGSIPDNYIAILTF